MQAYRLYFRDRFSGHIAEARIFEAEADKEAAVISEGWSDGRAMELWDRGRMVKVWPALPISGGSASP